jgi:hypothetical protein
MISNGLYAAMVNTCFRNTRELVAKVKVFPCHAIQHRGEAAVQLYSFFKLGARYGRVVKVNPRPLYPWERFLVSVVQEAVWGPAPVWRDVESEDFLSPPGFETQTVRPVGDFKPSTLFLLQY